MKRIAAILLGGLLLAFSGQFAAASSSLTALDPYLVAPKNLSNIDLSSFLSGNPNLANYSAAAISADSASAGILLLETDSLSDVTFSIKNGTATLLPYAANFLTQAPQTGGLSLVVTNGNFIHVNGHYYVPALLQGPLAGYSSANAIAVDAAQDGSSSGVNLALVIPPLVLVHGLWGDKSSLGELQEYVDSIAPWNTQTQLVVPICYSLFLTFDAKKDPLSNGKDPCEVTSKSALQTEIDSLMAELDSEHIVGSRVDIAAHSMGGLAARNYASKSTYASVRNRMLGQFHTIVTLDTPEIGSLLANYLVSHRSNTRKAPKWTPPGFIWEQVCGSTDVETCFAANSYPLSGPGLPIKTGGVYALEPNSPDLQNPNLVGPNIANATWRAITATAPGNSALAIGLDTLISALYANPYGNVPTVNSILDKLPNDAIVTVQSQSDGANGANQTYNFTKLSHTSLVGSILTWLSGQKVNDNSVTDDPSGNVDTLAACWLVTSGASSCVPQEIEVPVAQSAPANIVLKPVDRIDVHAPSSVVLGRPFEIAVRLRTPGVAPSLAVYQRGEQGRVRLEPIAIARSEGNILYANVTPKLPGPLTLGIRAAFGDGGVSVRQVDTYVALPRTPPLVFKANELPALVMTLNSSSQMAMPHPFAVYPSPVGRIDLNSSFVSWTLLPQKGGKVVMLERNGLLRALAPGEAMAEARLGSSVDRLRIIVRATQQ